MSEPYESDSASPSSAPTLVRGLSTWDGALLTIGAHYFDAVPAVAAATITGPKYGMLLKTPAAMPQTPA